VKLGVTRAYQIRHGAGPLVVDDPSMAERLLPDEVGKPDRYRGKVRVGPLDMVALRYALNVCGGPQAFDGLAVTWFDYVTRAGMWKICDRYEGATAPEYFTPEGEIRVMRGTDNTQLGHQERLSKALGDCRPRVVEFPVQPGAAQSDMIALCSGVLKDQLGASVRMMSFGPTEADKVCF
jgi:adenylosuccinate synthase